MGSVLIASKPPASSRVSCNNRITVSGDRREKMMSMFRIQATDKVTGKTIYGRVNGREFQFRTGVAFSRRDGDTLGLHLNPEQGTAMDIMFAGATLTNLTAALGPGSWISDPRIVLA